MVGDVRHNRQVPALLFALSGLGIDHQRNTAQPGIDAGSSKLAGAHREDHRGRTGDDIATREDPRDGRHLGHFFGDDATAVIDLELFGGLGQERIGALADADDHRIELDLVLAALDRDRTRAARQIRLTELHLLNPHAA